MTLTTVDVLKGMTPVSKLGSGYRGGGFNTYPIANGLAENIGQGDPVRLSGGKITLASNGAACIGVFDSVRYVDPNTGQLTFRKNFPTGTSSKGGVQIDGGYTQPLANVYDDANEQYVVRTHSTSMSAGHIGTSFKMSAIGSVVAGRSQAVLDVAASAGSSGGHMVTVMGLWTGRNSEWGTGPIAVVVKLSNHGIVGEL